VIVDGDVGASATIISVTIIEPAFGTMPQSQLTLPAVGLQKSRIQSLHEALKLDLAHYFVPDKLNAIIGSEVARSRH
jgi:hypothetical protein